MSAKGPMRNFVIPSVIKLAGKNGQISVDPQYTHLGSTAGVVIACTGVAPEVLNPSYSGQLKGVLPNAIAIAQDGTAGYNQHVFARTPSQVADPSTLVFDGSDNVLNVQPGEWVYFALIHQPTAEWIAANPGKCDSLLAATRNT